MTVDLATIIGLFVAFAMMIMGIITGDDGIAGIRFFWDFKSVLITFGGAIFSTMASYPLKDFVAGVKSFLLIFKTPSLDVPGMIGKVIDLSNVARKEGLLALEEAANESIEDEFVKKVEALQASAEIKEAILKEIERYKRLGGAASEGAVARTYIETLLSMPWDKATQENFALSEAKTCVSNISGVSFILSP